ncbi:MAG: HPP family protein [Amnibacterium sp.]
MTQVGSGGAPLDRFEGGALERATGNRAAAALYAALLSLLVLALAGAVGLALKQPWLFPSLGPTVMLFFQSPRQRASRPVHALVGHGVALVVGWLCLVVFGLVGAPPVPVAGLTPPYLVAGALSVALTTGILALLKLEHPPAGATTLIVSLGIIATPVGVLTMAAAVVLVTLAGWVVNRLLLGRRV